MKVKCAMMIVNKEARISCPFYFDNFTYLVNSSISDIFTAEEIDHERNSLGTIDWNEIERSHLKLFTWLNSESPEVINGENEQLVSRTNLAWYSLLVSETSYPYYGQTTVFVGSAEREGSEIKRFKVSQTLRMIPIRRQFYENSRGNFYHAFRHFDQLESWVKSWKNIYLRLATLTKEAGVSSLLFDFLESFQQSRSSNNPITALARLVEASEAMIGMSKEKKETGEKAFKKFAAKILSNEIPNQFIDSYDSATLQSKFKRIYQIRNSRCHALGSNQKIKEIIGINDNEELEIEFAKLLFLTEQLAKKAFLLVINNEDANSLLRSREDFEEGWAKKILEGHISHTIDNLCD